VTEARPPWSSRRRKLLVVLGVGAVIGVTALFLGGLCGFLLATAVVVFLTIPGPETLAQLLRMPPLAGAVFVVAVLLALSDPAGELRWLWIVAAVAAAAWAAFAVWETHRSGG
jgi:hypothetical protein